MSHWWEHELITIFATEKTASMGGFLLQSTSILEISHPITFDFWTKNPKFCSVEVHVTWHVKRYRVTNFEFR